jgi:hypothetical protein
MLIMRKEIAWILNYCFWMAASPEGELACDGEGFGIIISPVAGSR